MLTIEQSSKATGLKMTARLVAVRYWPHNDVVLLLGIDRPRKIHHFQTVFALRNAVSIATFGRLVINALSSLDVDLFLSHFDFSELQFT